MIKYDKQTHDKLDVYYDILDDGFKIYIGQTVRPTFHQYEPYIPDPSKSYKENALKMCEELCKTPEKPLENKLDNMQANIDYLLLLNDPDSATEDTAN